MPASSPAGRLLRVLPPGLGIPLRRLPGTRRAAVEALVAFTRWIDASVDAAGEGGGSSLIEQMESLRRLRAELGDEAPPPTTGAWSRFRPHARACGIVAADLRDIMEAASLDRARLRQRDEQQLDQYTAKAGGAPVWLLACVLAGGRPPQRAEWLRLGSAISRFDLVTTASEALDRGRIYIPLQELERHRCTEADVASRRMGPGLDALATHELGRARAAFAEGRALADTLADKPSRRLLRAWLRLEEARADAFEDRGRDLFAGPIVLPLATRLRIAWG